MDGTPIAGRQFEYVFDAEGNHVDTGWFANELNQYEQIPGFDDPLQYDQRGNLAFDNTVHYGWDAADRLIEARNSEVKLTFGYDPDGRRAWKKTFGWNAALNGGQGGWELQGSLAYAYDGWNLLAEFTVDPDGSKHLARSYTWGLDMGGGIGGLLMVSQYDANETVSARYMPLYDGSGNIMGLANEAGAVVAMYDYSPFLEVLSSQGPAKDAMPLRVIERPNPVLPHSE